MKKSGKVIYVLFFSIWSPFLLDVVLDLCTEG